MLGRQQFSFPVWSQVHIHIPKRTASKIKTKVHKKFFSRKKVQNLSLNVQDQKGKWQNQNKKPIRHKKGGIKNFELRWGTESPPGAWSAVAPGCSP